MTFLPHLEAQEQVDLPTGFTLTRMLRNTSGADADAAQETPVQI